jgi:hypothetical protein
MARGRRLETAASHAEPGEAFVQASGISNNSAMQALDALIASLQSSASNTSFGPFSAGQSLPGGADSTTAASTPTSPPQSTPSSQFSSDALSFLTSLQDIASGVADVAVTAAVGSSPMGMAAGIGVSDVFSALDQLGKSLNSGSASTSSVATASLATASLSATTSSSLVQALDQLNATLQSLESTDGTHHHHHHHGEGAADGSGVQTAGTGSSTTTASVGVSNLSSLS